jgi:hypothetical protein
MMSTRLSTSMYSAAMAAYDDRTYVSATGAIRMRALPGLLVQVITGKGTVAEWEAGQSCFGHAVLGARYVMLFRLSPNSGRDAPDDDFRKAVSKCIEAQSARLVALGYAVVVERGMLGATARAVITGISMVTRHSHAEKVFAEVQPAADWLHQQLPQGQTSKAMVEALDGLMALQAPLSR